MFIASWSPLGPFLSLCLQFPPQLAPRSCPVARPDVTIEKSVTTGVLLVRLQENDTFRLRFASPDPPKSNSHDRARALLHLRHVLARTEPRDYCLQRPTPV